MADTTKKKPNSSFLAQHSASLLPTYSSSTKTLPDRQLNPLPTITLRDDFRRCLKKTANEIKVVSEMNLALRFLERRWKVMEGGGGGGGCGCWRWNGGWK